MISDPFPAPALYATDICALDAEAIKLVGASGFVYDVTDPDAVDASDSPAALTAFIITVYAVPLVNPEITIGLAVVPALVKVAPLSIEYL
jgi:hypothetical protein